MGQIRFRHHLADTRLLRSLRNVAFQVVRESLRASSIGIGWLDYFQVIMDTDMIPDRHLSDQVSASSCGPLPSSMHDSIVGMLRRLGTPTSESRNGQLCIPFVKEYPAWYVSTLFGWEGNRRCGTCGSDPQSRQMRSPMRRNHFEQSYSYLTAWSSTVTGIVIRFSH